MKLELILLQLILTLDNQNNRVYYVQWEGKMQEYGCFNMLCSLELLTTAEKGQQVS